ncbi:MAG: phenylalanine--tRNA ligase subunit beta [Rickettsiales bacterium]|nr:phenylalanine--tRNA ligase subunit beta [Rickettsiales bacterium]
MKFTLSWLKEYLDTNASLDEISKTLTAIGLEVEDITDASAALAAFTVAEILSAEKHPDADKLQVCKVKSDEGELQIVCGAPNARAGIKVALAKVGALIPNGEFKIKKSKIRGVESCGMLCSADELNLEGDASGIIELPEEATIGQAVADALGLNDPMIEIAITPNRGDCLGVYGIARDLAAAGLGTLKERTIPEIKTDGAAPISIALNTDVCKIFAGRVIKGVKNGPSPAWLQQRLKAVGLRPISTLVDITNWMTMAHGRPLHVYDISKLSGNINVRLGEKEESFEALNDKSYTLEGGECVIADDAGMLGLGGVVGGVPSGVTEETTDVLLECAWFEPIHIAEVGRKHSIDSDARYRFERTVDPAFVVAGEQLAAQMIIDLCGGTPCDAYVAGEEPITPCAVKVSVEFINQLGGITLSAKEMTDILTPLGFSVSANGNDLTVDVPSWRPDVTQAADIAEEVLRIFGYDNVEAVPMPKLANVSARSLDDAQIRHAAVRRALAANGLHETHTWAFLSEETANLYGSNDDALKLVNPISSDLSVMRPSLIPNLLDACARNQARGFDRVHLFEVGPAYLTCEPNGQEIVGCAVRSGIATSKQWQEQARTYDVFDAKSDAIAILKACGMDEQKVQITEGAPDHYHPGRSGTITLGPKNILGYFGEIHPLTQEKHDGEHVIAACEIFLDRIPTAKAKKNAALKSSDYQAVERDFAFIIDVNTPAETLLKAIRGADKQLIRNVKLFDVYEGKGVEEGKRSIALSVKLQSDAKTLSEEEIEAIVKKITDQAASKGAQLRA